MIGYASRTGSGDNLRILREIGWRILVSAEGVWRNEGFKYCIDNGAYTAYQQKRKWDPCKFRDLVELMGGDADFVVAPDIVLGGLKSLELTEQWLDFLDKRTSLTLISVQDGMEPKHIERIIRSGRWRGVFIGGSSKWKESSMPMWSEFTHDVDCYLHVGRINSLRKIRLCIQSDVDSFDGTSLTKFAKMKGFSYSKQMKQLAFDRTIIDPRDR